MTWTSYPTDLTDEQWQAIAGLVPKPKPGGRPAKYSRREIVNVMLYKTRNARVWRALPHDQPSYCIIGLNLLKPPHQGSGLAAELDSLHLCIQHFSYFVTQCRRRERFLEEGHFRL